MINEVEPMNRLSTHISSEQIQQLASFLGLAELKLERVFQLGIAAIWALIAEAVGKDKSKTLLIERLLKVGKFNGQLLEELLPRLDEKYDEIIYQGIALQQLLSNTSTNNFKKWLKEQNELEEKQAQELAAFLYCCVFDSMASSFKKQPSSKADLATYFANQKDIAIAMLDQSSLQVLGIALNKTPVKPKKKLTMVAKIWPLFLLLGLIFLFYVVMKQYS